MFTIENILTLLKGYRTNVRTIRQLEFELAQIQNLFTEEDVILSLALSAPDGDTVSTGRISDRTFDTALRYQDEAGSIRGGHSFLPSIENWQTCS